MTTYNTGNPVGSTDARDLYDNSQTLDQLVNGSGTYSTRLGVQRRTLAKLEADFDAQLADAESDLNVYRSEAAASAAEAFGYLQAYRATSYGALASDPATDPLGNPPTVGDEYFNTTSNLLKRWNGTTWQASDINTANLAASSGSSLVGYDGGTVQDVLDGSKSLQDYAALRAYTGRAKRIYITGLLVTAKPTGIAGTFQYDPTDTTSIDDGATIIVLNDGRRFKRDFDGAVNVKWFGAVGNYVSSSSRGTNDRDAFIRFFDYCKTNKRKGFIPKSSYYIGTPLPAIGETSSSSTLLGNFAIEGEDAHSTTLIFDLTDNNDVAFQIAPDSSGWDMRNFGLRNITSKKGVGFYVNGAYTSNFQNIQVFGFDINWKKRSYVTTFINVEGANGNCGFYDMGGTSTQVTSSWMNYNAPLAGDARPFAGCGWYVEQSDYNKYSSCAADSNTIAYKVKTIQADYPGFVQDTLEFDNCGTEGCGSAWVIDAKGADIRINRPTAFSVGDGKLAHVENAYSVVITSHSDPVLTNVTRGLCCVIQAKDDLPLTPGGLTPRAPSRACPVA